MANETIMEKLRIKSEVLSPSTTVATENLYARFNHSGGQKLEHVRIPTSCDDTTILPGTSFSAPTFVDSFPPIPRFFPGLSHVIPF